MLGEGEGRGQERRIQLLAMSGNWRGGTLPHSSCGANAEEEVVEINYA